MQTIIISFVDALAPRWLLVDIRAHTESLHRRHPARAVKCIIFVLIPITFFFLRRRRHRGFNSLQSLGMGGLRAFRRAAAPSWPPAMVRFFR